MTSRIILTGQNWDHWIQVIQAAAMEHRIWEYMDPDVDEKDLPKLERPEFPHFSMVKKDAQSITELNELEVEHFRHFEHQYEKKIREIEKKEEMIRKIRTRIMETTSPKLATSLEVSWTPHRMLQTLKKQTAPRGSERERNASYTFRHLMKGPKGMDVKEWLVDLEIAFEICKKMNLPEGNHQRAVYQFVRAMNDRDPGFHYIWRDKLLHGTYTFYDVVDSYRNWVTFDMPEYLI
ncbi:hypothetical protein VTN02DRAFT_3394 [Thermoascus thermophilus]